ncbi:unnamed protein product [Tilletia controversa]|uniref:Initiator tRNA phosphoribosyl transferase n=1 Tax=Tilletia controversa TaxID=13291 RepID=A0A8X7MYF8_9BASI|nr:hypothetical protein CF328_g77 [Tilletia controversa]KAE8253490.1 hypothetical protein A4X06_0g1416 [Tilletia controversa]CAD6911785.1 unnamed protein product [Tilletia controversa]CAD6913291.1 unnamed protein product [Tilletia controversa]CAD6921587.1 unnamed protein product [Tilletia controversa]
MESESKALQKDLRKEFKRKEKDLFNRLWSIKHDADFVSRVADTLHGLPLVANLRCGAWYTGPRRTDSTCYFKSTDGHTGEWGFSLKRHNLGLMTLIVLNGGCIIVDSTRSGKTMPDALSKTIPIWCAVLNRASALVRRGSNIDKVGGFDSLVTPERLVSRSEHAQIEARVEAWAKSLLDSDLKVPSLPASLRPFFVTPDTDLTLLSQEIENETAGVRPAPSQQSTTPPPFLPVILLSASHARSQALPSSESAPLGTGLNFEYVQGGGDDEENWAGGLTPALFWHPEHHPRIIGAERGGEIEDVVQAVVDGREAMGRKEEEGKDCEVAGTVLRRMEAPWSSREGERQVGWTGIFLSAVPSAAASQEEWARDVATCFNLVVQCDGEGTIEDAVEQIGLPAVRLVKLGFRQGKAGVSSFGHHLPAILNALIKRLCQISSNQNKVDADDTTTNPTTILLCDTTCQDLAPSLAVALLSTSFGPGPDRRFLANDEERWMHQARLDKAQVRRRLQWVMEDEEEEGEEGVMASNSNSNSKASKAGPARVFLNRVNGEVLDVRRRRDYGS